MAPVMVARINTIRGEKDNQKEILRLLNNSFGYMMMLAVPATIGLIMVAPRFVPLFFGEEFIPATISLQILSFLILIIGISNLFGWQVLFAMGYEKKILKTTLFGAISNICLSILLVRQYGSLGASVAYVITEIIVMIMVIVFALHIMPMHINKKNIYQPLLASLPIILVSLFCNIIEYNLNYLLATIVISGTLYISILLFVFKNESAKQLLLFLIRKIKHKF
jgi:O-antigen/teichoic acid export membrane protein